MYWQEEAECIRVYGVIKDETIFGRKLVLRREIEISKRENSFVIRDEMENTGDRVEPLEVLYHMNMGYPLLDEESIVKIPAKEVLPRNDHAAEDIDNCLQMEKPQAGYEERCYYHKFNGKEGCASICQPKIGMELAITFDAENLDGFVEWKMMGVRDYVLGLECGNCYPDGRDVMRKIGMLNFLQPGEKKRYEVKVEIKKL